MRAPKDNNMKKFFYLLLIGGLLSAGCMTGIKPAKIPTITPIPAKVLSAEPKILTTNNIQTNKLPTPIIKSPKFTEQTKMVLREQTNSSTVTNIVSAPAKTPAKPIAKKKKNYLIYVTYYGFVLAIASFWFFYGNTKFLKRARRHARLAQNQED